MLFASSTHKMIFEGHKVYLNKGYPSIKVDKLNRLVHMIVWERRHGKVPPGFVLHHRNGNKLDWRLRNLRLMRLEDHVALHNALRRKERRIKMAKLRLYGLGTRKKYRLKRGWVLDADGHWLTRPCSICRKPVPVKRQYYKCTECAREYQKVYRKVHGRND